MKKKMTKQKHFGLVFRSASVRACVRACVRASRGRRRVASRWSEVFRELARSSSVVNVCARNPTPAFVLIFDTDRDGHVLNRSYFKYVLKMKKKIFLSSVSQMNSFQILYNLLLKGFAQVQDFFFLLWKWGFDRTKFRQK